METTVALTAAVDDRRQGGIVPPHGELRSDRDIFAPYRVAGTGIRAGRKDERVALPCCIDGTLNLVISIVSGNMNRTREYFLKVHIHMCNHIRADVFGSHCKRVGCAEGWLNIRADPFINPVSRLGMCS